MLNAVLIKKNKRLSFTFLSFYLSFFVLLTISLLIKNNLLGQEVKDFFKSEDINHFFAYAILIFGVLAITIGLVLNYQNNKENDYYLEKYFKESDDIKKLKSYFKRRSRSKQPISKCLNYHNGRYFDDKDTQCIEDHIKCDDVIIDISKYCDKTKGAILADFYVLSSNQSCLYRRIRTENIGNYVSLAMLETVIDSGARLLDLDIYTEFYKGNAIPVVKSEWRNQKAMNYISLFDCFKLIESKAFINKTYTDPLFIHLRMKSNNLETCDRLASQIIEVFSGNRILGPEYSYKNKQSICSMPLCSFFGKVIIIVTGRTENTYLDQLTNIHTSHNARILQEDETSNPNSPEELLNYNKNNITIVKPTTEKNFNPSRPYSFGCQFVMMNLWRFNNSDNQMKSNFDFFRKSSFVMKNLDKQNDRESMKTIDSSDIKLDNVEMIRV
tara:strand:- start:606 stop:1928 length:1323 start_codon:yes stop_codon:yes gene_type:complete